MAAVHPQPSQDSLPPGWECRYDPRTGRHYFLNHLEHITTWEDPRLRPSTIQQSYPPYYGSGHYSANVTSPPPPPVVSPPATNQVQLTNGSGGYYSPSRPFTQGGYSPHYGSPRTPYRFKQENSVQVDECILMKLCVQFPTVEEGHIWQLLKQYHNRENVVVSALLAEGQPRAQTHSMDITPKLQKAEIPAFQVDEALFHKLRNFFPAAESEHIRNLQKLYNNQEHEVIGALVAGNRGYNSRYQSPHPSSPKMKLRYLKLVFPEADEAILFDVLNNCDNNAQEASTRLIVMGYSKRDTPITRPNISQPVRKPSLEIPRPPPTPERPVIVIPPSASDKLQLVGRLQEQFPAVSRTLVNMALDSSNYNEERAKQFLTAMTPQDGVRPAVPSLGTGTHPDGSGTVPSEAFPESPPVPPPRSRHTSASQDSDGSRHSSLERHSLRGDSSREATPSKSPIRYVSTASPVHKVVSTSTPDHTSRPKFKKEVLKVSKATSTHNEFENLSVYRTRPKGPDPTLRKGPCESLLLKEYMPWIGPDPKNHKGPNPSICRWSDPKNLGSKRESRAKGPQRDLHRGPLASLKHSKIAPAPSKVEADTDNSRSS